MSRSLVRILSTLAVGAAVASPAFAQTTTTTPATAATPTPTKSKFETLTEGLKHEDGLWSMYHNDQKLLVLLKNSDLNKNFVVITSIARGISRGSVLGGMSWGFGDEVIWNFRKVGDNVHVLRKNVRFKAKAGTPEANAVKLAYSDSVLYALPVLTSTSSGVLVDMTRIFMSDDEQIGQAIGPGFRFASDRSTWAKVKAYPGNVELQVGAVYAGGGDIDTVSDTRGVQVHVHYSISELPGSNGFQPREADDRVGYFLSVAKDFSSNDDDQHFVRYINRWNLQKADSSATLSPPKEPIIFYLERTVPIRLRPIVREGIEEWNKAFEKIGFANAIEVRQQRDEDDWDPEDIRYNTFRWITAEAGFAMGPSRVNPLTGQIMDADIIFDASFLKYWKTDYETFSPEAVNSLMLGGGLDDGTAVPFGKPAHKHDAAGLFPSHSGCSYGHGMQQQMGFAAAALAMQGLTDAKGEVPEAFIKQGLKEVVMHEVGHTLGLRHNFKASAWKPLAEIDDPVKGAAEGTVGSVMDYTPANIVQPGAKQGLYYPTTIGPYDFWAIEYGYKPIASNEKAELAKIAARGAEKGLHYATDEDTRGTLDSDPLVNRFDLGSNPLEFADRRMKISNELLPKVLERAVKDGDGYQRARQAFGMLFSEYWRSAFFVSRVPGGVMVNRDHKADPNARAPFEVVDGQKQRDAMKLLGDTVFGTPKYDPKTLNYLAATRWSHWGTRNIDRLDYPIHDNVLLMQERILGQLMSPNVMNRLSDSELKVAADQNPYTLAEHMKTLVDQLFAEWKPDDKKGEYKDLNPYISSFRRNLQRTALKRLAAVVTSGFSYPEDARTLARMHLSNLDQQITALLAKQDLKLDDYSKAHLLDCQGKIRQVLNQQLTTPSIN